MLAPVAREAGACNFDMPLAVDDADFTSRLLNYGGH